ncbi:MAG TPA: AmmeMemoRadiSam system protein B [Candidatus Norongarragalinales archaeon]|jgi:hypothetical protein|nr:AmmeMemoRadiSam system protein B [Candidatus Norongarragalinales archaeon]
MREMRFAGKLYPADKAKAEEALAQFEALAQPPGITARVPAIISPHSAWDVCGTTIATAFKALKHKPPEIVVIVSPTHESQEGIGLSLEDWETPLGIARTDAKSARALLEHSDFLQVNEELNKMEQGNEVILPFVQHFLPEASVVNIVLGLQSLEVAKDIAGAVFAAEKALKKPFALVASSDLSHFEDVEKAREKDMKLLEPVKRLNARSFLKRIHQLEATPCAPAAISAAVEFARLKHAKKGKLLQFTNSPLSPDDPRVTDYAAIAFA